MDPTPTAALEADARRLGADLFGVADLAAAGGLETTPGSLFEGYRRAVLVGLKLPGAAVDECLDGPTPAYHHAYAVANQLLDELGFRLARAMERAGGRALPLPASKPLDPKGLSGHVSYKTPLTGPRRSS